MGGCFVGDGINHNKGKRIAGVTESLGRDRQVNFYSTLPDPVYGVLNARAGGGYQGNGYEHAPVERDGADDYDWLQISCSYW